jgi:magnesium transporter
MPPQVLSRRSDRVGDTVRKLVRRGALTNLSRVLGRVRPEDVAVLFSGLTPAEQKTVFEVVLADYPEAAGELVVELEPSTRLLLLEEVGPERVAKLLEAMPVDDAVDVLDWLPDDLREQVLEIADVGGMSELHAQLTYQDGTAGRIMNTDLFSLPEATTVEQAIARIQQMGEVEMIFYLYVVDRDGHLVGVTSLRQLLMTAPETELGEIMKRSVIKVATDTDQEEVARLVSRYDLLAVPVVDEANHLVGIVTVDDIVGILEEEADEDFYKMVGSSDDEILHQEKSWRVARIRLPWILFNLLGLVASGIMLHHFQVAFDEALFLLAFVPVVLGMGGNIGSQTSTITVRGLATGRVGEARLGHFLWQQIRVGSLLGLVSSLLCGLAAVAWMRNLAFGVVVSAALFSAIFLASLSGAVVPILFERLGIDPAVAAGPLVTTSSDIAGIILYFGFASLLIGWLV